jgi:uncharacterized protein YprB with RNaseH-like and TPR domain
MFPPDRIYAFDTETDNSRGHGLNPLKAGFTDLSLATSTGEQVFTDADEAAMLRAFDAAVYGLPAGLMSTWNGTHFDLPFLDTRFEHVGMIHHSFTFVPTPQFPPKYELLPGHDSGLTATILSKTGVHAHLDIAYAFKPIAARLGAKWGLKPVAKALGFEVIEVDRQQMHLLTEQERQDYAVSDARVTRQLTCWLLGLDAALGMDRQPAASAVA